MSLVMWYSGSKVLTVLLVHLAASTPESLVELWGSSECLRLDPSSLVLTASVWNRLEPIKIAQHCSGTVNAPTGISFRTYIKDQARLVQRGLEPGRTDTAGIPRMVRDGMAEKDIERVVVLGAESRSWPCRFANTLTTMAALIDLILWLWKIAVWATHPPTHPPKRFLWGDDHGSVLAGCCLQRLFGHSTQHSVKVKSHARVQLWF